MKLTEHVSLLSGLLLDTAENVYAVRHEYGLVLIDTGWGTAARNNIQTSLQEEGLAGLSVTHVLLTHMHDDHSGNAAWLRRRGAQIWCPEADASGVESGGVRVNDYGAGSFETCTVDRCIAPDEAFVIGGVAFQTVHAPGHTNGSTLYCFDADGKRFCATGDVLHTMQHEAGAGVSLGWAGSYELDRRIYLQTLEKLLPLRFDVLLGGHGFPLLQNGSRLLGDAFRKALIEWR